MTPVIGIDRCKLAP